MFLQRKLGNPCAGLGGVLGILHEADCILDQRHHLGLPYNNLVPRLPAPSHPVIPPGLVNILLGDIPIALEVDAAAFPVPLIDLKPLHDISLHAVSYILWMSD